MLHLFGNPDYGNLAAAEDYWLVHRRVYSIDFGKGIHEDALHQ
jgi:hypothetical protein